MQQLKCFRKWTWVYKNSRKYKKQLKIDSDLSANNNITQILLETKMLSFICTLFKNSKFQSKSLCNEFHISLENSWQFCASYSRKNRFFMAIIRIRGLKIFASCAMVWTYKPHSSQPRKPVKFVWMNIL